MADTSSEAVASGNDEGGTWQTVEQAAVMLGLSVRTVNRHISALKLKSRLIDGRREVFVASPATTEPPGPGPSMSADATAHPNANVTNPPAGDAQPASDRWTVSDPSADDVRTTVGSKAVNPPFDLQTALARTDRELASSAMSVSAYQSLTRSMEVQAQGARQLAMVAWCVVAVLVVGVTVAVGWTASRLTRAETESQNLREKADSAVKHADSLEAVMADLQEKQEKETRELREKAAKAENEASTAKGQVSVYEKLQLHEPASRPTTRNLIDRLTSAFNGQ